MTINISKTRNISTELYFVVNLFRGVNNMTHVNNW